MLSLERFEEHLTATGLWPAEGRVLVGYSGGADSTCLVHLLAAGGRDIVAAHLHHGMRPEADKEMELSAAFCEALGVPFAGGHANVSALALERRVGVEEAGRIARYSFLQQAGRQHAAVRIATAHTRTDHVETVLLHVIRGSGRRGLGGIAAESGDLIRPLLPFSRSETRGYCSHHGLWFHDDPANEDDQFARSRLRNRVFPVLHELNPSVEDAVARLAEVMREEDAFLDGAAAATLERLEAPLNGALGFLTRDIEVALDLDHIRHYPLPLIRRGVRLCFETLGSELDHRQTALVVDGMFGGVKGSVTAEGGSVATEWDHQRLRVYRLLEPAVFDEPVPIPGRVEAPELGWTLTSSREEGVEAQGDRASLTALIDIGQLQLPLRARAHRPGDRIQPQGFKGTRKLSDLFGEARLTVLARQRVPVVCDAEGPVWIPGVMLAERAGAKPGTKQVLKLTFGLSTAPEPRRGSVV
jgi:tRNA(Ile)-lysidine synthase